MTSNILVIKKNTKDVNGNQNCLDTNFLQNKLFYAVHGMVWEVNERFFNLFIFMVDYHFNFFKKYLTDPIFVKSIVYIFELSSFGGFP